jgi:hypothetical protein
MSPVCAKQPVQAWCRLGEDLRGLAPQLLVARAGYLCQHVAQFVHRANPLAVLGALAAPAAPGVTPGVRNAAAETVVTVVVQVPPKAGARAGFSAAGLVREFVHDDAPVLGRLAANLSRYVSDISLTEWVVVVFPQPGIGWTALRTGRGTWPPVSTSSAACFPAEPLMTVTGRAALLQEACSQALGPLPAPMPHESAAAAPKTKGFPGDPFHDPFHAFLLAQADGLGGGVSVTPFLSLTLSGILAAAA